MKRFAIAVLVVTACLPLPAKTKDSALTPVLIYSMDNCPACEALASTLAESGTRMKVVHTASANVDSFPTVIYSDGKRDSGRRIQNGLAKLPGSVRILKYNGE